jgi:putative transposase
MRKSHFSDEQIVKIVRESHAEGASETAKKYKVSENSIYIWRKK